MQNGFCESFNGRTRDELLNETLFFGLDHARAKIGALGERLQPRTPAFFPWLCNAGGICGQPRRNRRSAAQPRPAPPIACCYIRAPRRKTTRDSNRRWMKIQGQVTCIISWLRLNALTCGLIVIWSVTPTTPRKPRTSCTAKSLRYRQ